MNEGILTRSRFRNKTLANQAIFLFSISTTFITPPNYYMWLHVIAFLVNSVLRPFQDYFSSYETGQSVGGRKRENPEKNHLAHPQAELCLSHMWPERGSNPHQTQW